jgi:prevent-host-death family protein
MKWQLAEAKNKLSEVVNKALEQGPQRITRRDQVVVVISEAEFSRLTKGSRDLKSYLLKAPDLRGLDAKRDKTPMRGVEW